MRARALRRSATLLVVAVAVALAGLVAPPAAQAATNRIAGIVTVGGTHVEGVDLELVQWTGAAWSYGYGDTVTSASSGAFSWSDLEPGTYTVTVHRRFPNGTTTPPTGPGAPGAVTIDGDDQASLDVALPAPVRTVTGRVLRLDGTPAAGARVELGAWSASDHPSGLFTTVTDVDGRYALPLYDDQAHTVTAWSSGHIRTLLGDTTRYGEATSFGIVGAPTLPDLTLQAQYVGGLATAPGGRPAPGTTIALLRWNHAQDIWVQMATTTTSAAGRYAFLDTGEGHFTVRVASGVGAAYPTTGLVVPFVDSYAYQQLGGPGYRWVGASAQVGDLDIALPPSAAGTPRVRGTHTVGQRLSADTGTWGRGYQLQHRWLRDGRVIPGATASTYRLVTADWRRRISVRVTATSAFPGLPTRQVSSTSTRVKALSRLTLRAEPRRRAARLTVGLQLPGIAAARTGHRLTVLVDGRARAVVRLRSGRATLTVRGLAAGRHRVVVRFAGTTDHSAVQVAGVVRVR